MLILFAGWKSRSNPCERDFADLKGSCWIGAVQGICLPFRGFSRSGATISTGLLLGITKRKAEEFSFALAVVLTPPVIIREVLRLLKAQHASALSATGMADLFYPSLLGMVLSFISGLLALRWLSNWLERGRWHLFGIYCLCASVIVFLLHNKWSIGKHVAPSFPCVFPWVRLMVGGMTDKPIIAVPTSTGYGTSLGGIIALFAMLNSCVPGIAVMNTDNGFGAASPIRSRHGDRLIISPVIAGNGQWQFYRVHRPTNMQ